MATGWTNATAVARVVATAKRDQDLDDLAEELDPGKAAHRTALAALSPAVLDRLAAHAARSRRDQGFAVRGTTVADKLAFAASRLADAGRFEEALKVFDAVVKVPNLELSTYNNALWAVQNDNNGLGVNPARARAYLDACVPYGSKNPSIFFNAACVWFELGERDQVYEAIREARRHGFEGLQKVHEEPLFKPLRGVPEFEALFTGRDAQGAELVRQLVKRLTSDPKARRDFGITSPRGLAPEVLKTLTLPNGARLPPSLRVWLEFDATWLQGLGWFSSLEPVRWSPRSLREVVAAELGQEWAPFFDLPGFSQCFVLDGGAESRRVFVVTDSPDALGEHPVMLVDIDDLPYLCAFMPGLDVYLAEWGSLMSFPRGSYEDVSRDPRIRDRVKHHADHLLGGELGVEFPVKALTPPPPTPPSRVRPSAPEAVRRATAPARAPAPKAGTKQAGKARKKVRKAGKVRKVRTPAGRAGARRTKAGGGVRAPRRPKR